MQTYSHSFSTPVAVQAGLVMGALPRSYVDRVPPEGLNSVPLPRDRMMPWSPHRPVAPRSPAQDREMLTCIEDLVRDVNSTLANNAVDESAVANVGRVRPVRAKSVGIGRMPAKPVRHGLSDAVLNLCEEADEATTIAPLPRAPRFQALRRMVTRRRQAKMAATVSARAEQAFQARITRIRRGRQWQPDGVLNAVGRHGRTTSIPLGQRPNFRFMLFVCFAAGLTVLGIGPEALVSYGQTMVASVDTGSLGTELRQSGVVPGL